MISQNERFTLNKHQPLTIWFTGLSGSGKSTLAKLVEQSLFRKNVHVYVLDGDIIRQGLNKDLGFSEKDRHENIRRTAEVARLMNDAGIVVIAAFISPLTIDRELARSIVGSGNFIEVFVKCPLSVCEERDVKGLYKKARKGEVLNFTGIDAPFEEPLNPDLTVATNTEPLEVSLQKLLSHIETKIFKP